MLRGNNKRRLFSYGPDYRKFLKYVDDALAGFACVMHALVLMSNHLHMLVTPASCDALAGFVQSFAQRYAQYRNLRRGGTGKLFEQRYHAIPVLNELYLAVVTAYIELNPVRGGCVDEPFAYPWSTYPLHVGVPGGVIPPRLWTPSDWYLSLGTNGQERADAYAAWTHEVDPSALPPEHVRSIVEVESHSMVVRPDWRPNGQRAA
jgi:putative transposase